jgi:hypothetical protein
MDLVPFMPKVTSVVPYKPSARRSKHRSKPRADPRQAR